MSLPSPVDASGNKLGCSFLFKSNCCSKSKNEKESVEIAQDGDSGSDNELVPEDEKVKIVAKNCCALQ
tara:strand:- start:14043 stop:14246 length:204 start_codon:yes stop_codon:yes gene_type:complete